MTSKSVVDTRLTTHQPAIFCTYVITVLSTADAETIQK